MAAQRPGQDGFALVAALGAAMLFSLLAYGVLASDRGVLAGLDAELTQARLRAAAEGGLAMAVEGLGGSPGRRWPIDGRVRTLAIDGAEVQIAVEDERGKAPLNKLSSDQTRRLLQAAGLSGTRLEQTAASLMDWLDGDYRAEGAKDIDYASAGVRPRGMSMRTVGELMAVKGVDEALYARIAPALTVFFGFGGEFDPTTATSPIAVKAMTDSQAPSAAKTGPQPTLAGDADTDYLGRPFTVRLTASDGRGGVYRRTVIVELTGQRQRPYWVRAID